MSKRNSLSGRFINKSDALKLANDACDFLNDEIWKAGRLTKAGKRRAMKYVYKRLLEVSHD